MHGSQMGAGVQAVALLAVVVVVVVTLMGALAQRIGDALDRVVEPESGWVCQPAPAGFGADEVCVEAGR